MASLTEEQRIRAYLAGKLSPADRAILEQRLTTDPAFAEKVKRLRQDTRHFQHDGDRVRKRLQDVDWAAANRQRLRMLYLAAFIFLVAIVAWLVWWVSR